jgi:hypothetical protein
MKRLTVDLMDFMDFMDFMDGAAFDSGCAGSFR